MLTFYPPTTLQLAEAIAQAVSRWEPGATAHTPAVVVLDTLRRYQCWFCRLEEVEGATVETPLQPLPSA